ncbi:MAG: toll/interleukin-1 receptor domain-containing protein [Acidobacteria bacterium]|nr:toll/interleukin-1 receptor domain-containing protein [Acidobacteriota bacterium]
MADKYPKRKFHATEQPKTVNNVKEEKDLGPDWFDEYVYQAYPKVVYHLHGANKTVKDAEEQAALGPNWFELPTTAQDAENRMLESMTVRNLLSYSNDREVIDKYFRKRFDATQGKDKWRYVREYNSNFPDMVLESPWAAKLLPNMPRDKEDREELSVKQGIFISHIGEEREIAFALKRWLKVAFGDDLKVFVSSDYESIRSGADWHGQIIGTVKNSRAVIVLCSSDSITRPWINYEAGLGDGTDWDVSEVGSTYVVPTVIRGLLKGALGPPLSRKQLRDLQDINDATALFKDLSTFLKLPHTPIDMQAFTKEIVNVGASVQAVNKIIGGSDDATFESYIKRLLSDDKETEFAILAEDLRASATECWRITSSETEDAAAAIDRIKKTTLIPVLSRLTLAGILLAKYEAPPSWVRKVFDALEGIFRISNQLAKTPGFQNIAYVGETDNLESHRSTTVPALEALISFYAIGAYIVRKGASATQYLSELTPRIVERAVGRDDVYEQGRKPFLLWPITGKWGYPRVPQATMVLERYGNGRISDLGGGSDQLKRGTLELETLAEWHSYLALVNHPAPRISKYLADRFPKVAFDYPGQFLWENPNQVMAPLTRLWEWAKDPPSTNPSGLGLDSGVIMELLNLSGPDRIALILSFFGYIQRESAARLMQNSRAPYMVHWPGDIQEALKSYREN